MTSDPDETARRLNGLTQYLDAVIELEPGQSPGSFRGAVWSYLHLAHLLPLVRRGLVDLDEAIAAAQDRLTDNLQAATGVLDGTGGDDGGPGGPPRFGDFWAAYPVKQGRADAVDAWTEAIAAGANPRILTAAARRLAATPDLDPEFCPLPAVWLAQERWATQPSEGYRSRPTS